MEIREILKEVVNSGLINCENHDRDNGFFEDTLLEFERGLKTRNYEPVGICKHVPFPCSSSSQSVAFVYRYNDQIQWCHMPVTYWFHLLKEHYGYNEADKIIENILQY